MRAYFPGRLEQEFVARIGEQIVAVNVALSTTLWPGGNVGQLKRAGAAVLFNCPE